ncbi:Hypothetical predicted protein [Olea europaea subsp. europaea]|uniref:Uncharacterized protein n=1 Tax=Olea europaea subsp. europaea TaxID=158383 RepID=A0A8S0QY93_OLEEU|nr:Hypothetical predicted protein [Olea europaea subsp. europaea]
MDTREVGEKKDIQVSYLLMDLPVKAGNFKAVEVKQILKSLNNHMNALARLVTNEVVEELDNPLFLYGSGTTLCMKFCFIPLGRIRHATAKKWSGRLGCRPQIDLNG